MEADCCLKAELAAVLKLGGDFYYDADYSGNSSYSSNSNDSSDSSDTGHTGRTGDTFSHVIRGHIKITTENAAFARRIFSNIKSICGITPGILNRKNTRLRKHPTYIVTIPAGDKGCDPGFEFLKFNITGSVDLCCRKAYLRGAFLTSGSVSDPGKAYHLEITTRDVKPAAVIRRLMVGFGLKARTVARKGAYVTYVKEGEDIADFLNITGAHKSLLEFENIRIVKEMRNNVNRIVNCETANLEKTVNAAVRQVENIRYIIDKFGIKAIPENLKETAEKRMLFPEATLKELG